MSTRRTDRVPFYVELIRPSHYDDDGYLIQWARAYIPSNSLACLYGLADDAHAKHVLGNDVDIVVNAYDESHTIIPTRKIIRRLQSHGAKGIVMLVGVQTNQFPRAADLAREFRDAGIMVAVGGFHVSGCLAMLPELPPDIQALKDMGVTLFAGEAEGRMAGFLQDAWSGNLQAVYNYLDEMPALDTAVSPYLPPEVAKRYMQYTAFDAGRGCPFSCSFCTIINVQGRKSRSRSADEIELLARRIWSQGIRRFFITDDNFARNKNWEPIIDRLLALRREGIRFKFLIQVDTQAHKVPRFIEKVTEAGCSKVFIGLENINAANLAAANKGQNSIPEYRKMLLAWRARGVLTYAGYILGFPDDTAESIARDVEIIKRELPIDVVEFMFLTPLPGSVDHQRLAAQGVWMDPDMNKYDLEHPTTRHHPHMTPDELSAAYRGAWNGFYSHEHMETLVRRGEGLGAGARQVATMVWQYYGCYSIENVHPEQGGLLRKKKRRLRRPELPRENPLVFYPRRIRDVVRTNLRVFAMWRRINGIRKAVRHAPNRRDYRDSALVLEPIAGQERIAVLQPADPPAPSDQPRSELASTGNPRRFGSGIE